MADLCNSFPLHFSFFYLKFRFSAKDSHEIAQAQAEKNRKFKEALGIPSSYIDGSSLEKLKVDAEETKPKYEYIESDTEEKRDLPAPDANPFYDGNSGDDNDGKTGKRKHKKKKDRKKRSHSPVRKSRSRSRSSDRDLVANSKRRSLRERDHSSTDLSSSESSHRGHRSNHGKKKKRH